MSWTAAFELFSAGWNCLLWGDCIAGKRLVVFNATPARSYMILELLQVDAVCFPEPDLAYDITCSFPFAEKLATATSFPSPIENHCMSLLCV